MCFHLSLDILKTYIFRFTFLLALTLILITPFAAVNGTIMISRKFEFEIVPFKGLSVSIFSYDTTQLHTPR